MDAHTRRNRAFRWRVLLASAGAVASSVASSDGWAQEVGRSDPEVTASARAGVEWDDNPLRQTDALRQQEDISSDFLTRYIANIDAATRRPRDMFLFTLGQGGKLFFREDRADTLLTQVGLGWRHKLGDVTSAEVSADVKDRSERTSLQDYNRGGVRAQLNWTLWRLTLSARVGWRYFIFKPNAASSSHGPTAGGTAALALSPTWRAITGYQWLSRRFDSPRLTQPDGDESVLTIIEDELRQDDFHNLFASVSWRGAALVDLTYSASLNRSNSYGQDLRRHNVIATVTAPLPWSLFTSVRADVQRTNYEDQGAFDPNFRIDEDNRNNFVASLGRSLGDAWEVEVRYSVYLQEFGQQQEYSRQTLMFGVGYATDSRRR